MKTIILLFCFLIISGCKSEVDKCVDDLMVYNEQLKKFNEATSSAKTISPPKQGKTFEDFGYTLALPQPVPAPYSTPNTPEKAKAMIRIECLKAQAGK